MPALAALAFLALMAWLFWRSRFDFIVKVEKGRARAARGLATRAVLLHVEEVCRDHGLSRARISGVRRGGRVSLSFSRNIPEGARQRLRNVWHLHG